VGAVVSPVLLGLVPADAGGCAGSRLLAADSLLLPLMKILELQWVGSNAEFVLWAIEPERRFSSRW